MMGVVMIVIDGKLIDLSKMKLELGRCTSSPVKALDIFYPVREDYR